MVIKFTKKKINLSQQDVQNLVKIDSADRKVSYFFVGTLLLYFYNFVKKTRGTVFSWRCLRLYMKSEENAVILYKIRFGILNYDFDLIRDLVVSA